ncbi:GntR family transcriptional regulator [Streptomyces sp. NPDC059454]
MEHIAASGLTAGTRLVERALADHLKVSRSPVRRPCVCWPTTAS